MLDIDALVLKGMKVAKLEAEILEAVKKGEAYGRACGCDEADRVGFDYLNDGGTASSVCLRCGGMLLPRALACVLCGVWKTDWDSVQLAQSISWGIGREICGWCMQAVAEAGR